MEIYKVIMCEWQGMTVETERKKGSKDEEGKGGKDEEGKGQETKRKEKIVIALNDGKWLLDLWWSLL